MTTLVSFDANTLYVQALGNLLAESPGPAPRGMGTRELVGAVLHLTDARRSLVTLPHRRLNYHFAVAEFIWMATGRDDVASLAPYCSEIAQFSDDGKTFFGAYGTPWVAQIEYVIEKLRADPASRQAVITLWRPSPGATKDVPCTIAFQFLIRDRALNLIVTMRSSDAWLGLPYDLHNFGRLQASVAGELNCAVGWLQLQAGSFHLYDRNATAAIGVVDAGVVDRAPDQPTLPGLAPVSFGYLLEAGPSGALYGEPWTWYLEVLRHRHTRDSRDIRVGNPFAELILHGSEL